MRLNVTAPVICLKSLQSVEISHFVGFSDTEMILLS